MGGYGSGRSGGKGTVGQMRALDVRKLKRDGCLKPGSSGQSTWSRDGEVVASIGFAVEEGAVRLIYKARDHGGEWQDMDYRVRLDWTPCTYGGFRVWFICPSCFRRVALLYGGKVYACRSCHRLAYDCQRETVGSRATRQANKLRKRLQWEPGILNSDGWKPKWMRWRTFRQLSDRHHALVRCSLDGMQAHLDRIGGRLGGLRKGG